MPNMVIEDGKYKLPISISSAGTVSETLQTENTFVDKNIDVTVTTPAAAQTFSGGALTAGAGSTSLASDGLSNGTTVDATKKIALTETNANGYYELESSGSGSVSRGAVTKQVTTAGFMDAESSATTVIASGSKASNTAKKKYYVKQSTLSASSVTPATTAQTVTISDGYYHEGRTVVVNPMSGTTVTTGLTNSGMSTYFDSGSSSTYDVSITPNYSNAAGYIDAHTNTNNGGIAYYKIKKQTVTETKTTVSGSTATRGTRTEGVGWNNSSVTLDVSSFGNSGTAGHTYVDISATSQAPTLVSGDYLYINKGWTDDLKISLAKLVPDGSNITGHADMIVTGYTAYDNDGSLITGSLPVYEGAYVVN